MIVRILSCGVNWWGMHSSKENDPLRFRRRAAWFNTTGLLYGRRRRDFHIYPGLVRFNRTSGFDPEFVDRIAGKTFESPGPTLHDGKVHMLFQFPATGRVPDAYLVTIHSETHGQIEFRDRGWRSSGLQPIAVSRSRDRYEAMLLIRPGQWIETQRGRWTISPTTTRLALQEEGRSDAL